MTLEIVRANIVNVKADSVVLPANEALREGPGVSKLLFEAAGRKQLTKACKELGHCDVGNAVPTSAFNMPGVRYIIHAVVPKWRGGHEHEYEMLCSAYLFSLKLADKLGCSTIAFPLLASGHNGFNLELAFDVARDSILSFEGENLQKVILVIYGNHIASIVQEKGYDLSVVIPDKLVQQSAPDDNTKEAEKVESQGNKYGFDRFKADGKEIVKVFVDTQIPKVMEYLKDPDHQVEVFKAAAAIVSNVFIKHDEE